MDVRIMALCLMLCASIVCLNAETNVLVRKYITLITDQRRTDRKTHSYIKWQKSFIGRALHRLPRIVSDHICKIKWQINQVICREAQQFEEHGFYKGPVETLKVGCVNTPYSIRFSTLAQTENVSLPTITCPVVTYVDLETDLITDLPYTYKISNAGMPDSAVMYVQTDERSNEIYPLYFIQDIAFRKLKSYRKTLGHSKSLDPLPQTELDNKDDYIDAYLKARKANSPYTKFLYFYSSMNICGRPRPQNIYLCRRCIKKHFPDMVGMAFDLAGYDVSTCRQYDVSLSADNQYQIEYSESVTKLFMFKCPPVLIRYRLLRNFFHILYISSNLEHHSLTLFTRDNHRGTLPRPEVNIYELQMVPIFQDIKRQRFLPGPPKIITESTRARASYPQIENEINSFEGDLLLPPTMLQSIVAQIPTSYLTTKINEKVLQGIYTDKWIPDQVTILFSKVKTMKLIYQRFIKTHRSIEICSLSVKQRTSLCNETFKSENRPEKEQEKLPFKLDDDSQSTCTNNYVKLTTLDADELETNTFTMWECPGNMQQTRHMFFIGKNHLKNAATIYKQIYTGEEKNYFHPHILIAGINKYGLNKEEMEKTIGGTTGGSTGGSTGGTTGGSTGGEITSATN